MTGKERAKDLIERDACDRELGKLWSKYGLLVVIQAMADIVERDARMLERNGRFAGEVELKDGIVKGLREAANNSLWEI